MFYVFLTIQIVSIVLLLVEAAYIFTNIASKMHAYLFFFLVAVIVNNVGYAMEMTAPNGDVAYMATRFSYIGKVFVPVGILLFILRFCRVNFPRWGGFVLLAVHGLVGALVLTNDWHHLFYTSYSFVNEGFFPHNVYTHGPLYLVYQLVSPIYALIAIYISGNGMRKFPTKQERRQLLYLIESPLFVLVGFAVFLTGKTGGYDTTNVGFLICAVLMFVALFRYKLIDTADLVKEKVVDKLEDGIIATDSLGRFAYANDTAKMLFPMLEKKKCGEGSGIIEDLKRKSQTKEVIELNSKKYSVIFRNIIHENVFRGNLYILDDITEISAYIDQINEEKDRADEANMAKSMFLSNMSHEIRTPMNAIVGMTQIMLSGEQSKENIEYLQNIKGSGNALLGIINDILDFSKIESGKLDIIPDEYEPFRMINELKVIFQTRVGDKPIRLSYDIDPALPAKLYGDEGRIRQVIINLVNNAIKFTDVGFVKLSVSGEKIDAENLKMSVSVKDSGLGIKPEDMERLFESFAQLDAKKNRAKEGTGLGLSISKNLVELMGGELLVTSDYGSGSEFSFTINQNIIDSTPAAEYNYEEEMDSDVSYTAPGAKILLVEDNAVNVKVVKGLLAPLKMDIEVAENGLASLRKVSENQYDLIFMDHMMPVMDGVEATQKIRGFKGDYFAKVPIIALTANATLGAQETFMDAGMNDFIGKPIDITEMKKKIYKWLPKELIVKEEGKPQDIKGGNESMFFFKKDSKDQVKNQEATQPEAVEVSKEPQPETVEAQTAEAEQNVEFGTLDKEVGLTYCGDEELYNSVLEDFYKLIDTKAEKIVSLMDEGNIKDYTIEVHALKSTARMIGATPLSELSYEMEMAGKDNNVDLIHEKTPLLIKMYKAYKDTLSYFDAGSDAGDKKAVSNDEIRNELMRLKSAAIDFDMDTVDDAMEKLNSYDVPETIKSDISKLDLLVRDVALEEIKAACDRIGGML